MQIESLQYFYEESTEPDQADLAGWHSFAQDPLKHMDKSAYTDSLDNRKCREGVALAIRAVYSIYLIPVL